MSSNPAPSIKRAESALVVDHSVPRYGLVQHRNRLFCFDRQRGRLFEWSEAKDAWILVADAPEG